MDPDSVIPLLMLILSLISAMIGERTYRRYERYLEIHIPQPTEHLEMPPPDIDLRVEGRQPLPEAPSHRRQLTINIPPRASASEERSS